MLAQNYSTRLSQTRPVCGLSLEGWLRTGLRVSSSHCHLQSSDFLRLNKNHWKSSKLSSYSQGKLLPFPSRTSGCQTPPGNEFSWADTTSILQKRDLKGRASRWQEGIAQVSGRCSCSSSCHLCESVLCSCICMGGETHDLQDPSSTKIFEAHLEKLCFGAWVGGSEGSQSSLPLKS